MSSTRSSRSVRVNKRYREVDDDDDDSKLPRRRCERNGCPCDVPICFARVADRCAGSKWTSRWYHITPAEHFCNECFEYFYRCHKHGHQLFEEWKREWASHGRSEANLKKFMSDTLVPYWIQCTVPTCRKWRQLSKDVVLKQSFIDRYVCGMTASGMKKGNQKDACANPEDERVAYVEEDVWLRQTTVPPYLKDSPAALMLLGYYPDGVGISATDPVMHTKKSKPIVFPCSEYISPFVLSEGRQLVYMVMPDMMEKDEIAAFPLIAEYQPYTFLAIRNLILAIWSRNAKEWVTREHCARQLICRGLNRACCVFLLDPILAFLTTKGFINVGLVLPPAYLKINTTSQCDVLVIGAGASGLAAAHRMSHFGLKVKVLESKSRTGGRILDEKRGEACFAHGAQLMAGAVNNPMAILAYQCGEQMHRVTERCQLLQAKGKVVDPVTDRRLDFHFNALLDVLAQWRKSSQPDVSLAEKFKELHQEFEEETDLKFTQEEERILQFHLSSLEYVGGCPLSSLSALHWDQNEALPQFGDPHLILPNGYSALFQRLRQGLDIECGVKVTEVDYSGPQAVVKTTSGESYTTDKVLVTLPLPVLQSQVVRFEPPLPEQKVKAIASFGVGRIEKVILQFNENFWKKKTKGDDFFGCVPSSEASRGLFNLFYTVTYKMNEVSRKETYILVTHIVGQALDAVKDKTEVQVKDMCVKTLRAVFGKVPEPVSWVVTSWHRDADIQMTHTYLPVGVSGDAMDTLADTVAGRVYFAGEATCQQFPQSVAGAYLSGIREAVKIMDDISTSLGDHSDNEACETPSCIKAEVTEVETHVASDENHTTDTAAVRKEQDRPENTDGKFLLAANSQSHCSNIDRDEGAMGNKSVVNMETDVVDDKDTVGGAMGETNVAEETTNVSSDIAKKGIVAMKTETENVVKNNTDASSNNTKKNFVDLDAKSAAKKVDEVSSHNTVKDLVPMETENTAKKVTDVCSNSAENCLVAMDTENAFKNVGGDSSDAAKEDVVAMETESPVKKVIFASNVAHVNCSVTGEEKKTSFKKTVVVSSSEKSEAVKLRVNGVREMEVTTDGEAGLVTNGEATKGEVVVCDNRINLGAAGSATLS